MNDRLDNPRMHLHPLLQGRDPLTGRLGPLVLNGSGYKAWKGKEDGKRASRLRRKRENGGSNLVRAIQEPAHDVLVRRAGVPRLDAVLLVVLEALAQALGPVVEGVTERLVLALEGIMAGHEHLLSGWLETGSQEG